MLPLQAGAIVIGVLDLYRDEPGMLRPTSWRPRCVPPMRCCGPCSACAASSTAHRATAAVGLDPHGWLSGSPLNHTAVYQATGMVMGQLALSPEAALSRLRASAFVQDRADR